MIVLPLEDEVNADVVNASRKRSSAKTHSAVMKVLDFLLWSAMRSMQMLPTLPEKEAVPKLTAP